MIPKGEFARRLCLEDHFSQSVPCAHHVQMADRYMGLTTQGGTKNLKVIVKARVDGKVDVP